MSKDIVIVTPQFTRPRGEPGPACPPADAAAWAALRELSVQALRELGCRAWNDPKAPDQRDLTVFRTHTLMLLPGEWYGHIPEGFEVTDINGKACVFTPSVTDDDIRFGCLAFGVLVAA